MLPEGRSSYHGRSRKLLSSETRETEKRRPEAADQLDTNTPLAEGGAEPVVSTDRLDLDLMRWNHDGTKVWVRGSIS